MPKVGAEYNVLTEKLIALQKEKKECEEKQTNI